MTNVIKASMYSTVVPELEHQFVQFVFTNVIWLIAFSESNYKLLTMYTKQTRQSYAMPTIFGCFRFEFLAYTVFLKYQSSLLFTREEFAVVVIGPMSNVVIFSLLIMMVWAAQRVFGSFPNILSRFVVAFGIEAALDPILITIVDMAMGRYKNREGN